MLFLARIKEVLVAERLVEAEDRNSALDAITRCYSDGQVQLDYDNLQYTDFKIIDSKSEEELRKKYPGEILK